MIFSCFNTLQWQGYIKKVVVICFYTPLQKKTLYLIDNNLSDSNE